MLNTIINWDFSVLQYIQENLRTPFLDTIMPFMEYLFYGGFIFIILGIVLLFFKKTRSTGIMVILGVLFVIVIGELGIKTLVGRVRPCIQKPIDDMLIKAPFGFSFPSTHTSTAFAAATVMFLKAKKSMWLMFIVAAFVGFTRLYLCVHFPTDVIAGAILGIVVGVMIYLIFKLSGLLDKIDGRRLHKHERT